MGKVEEAAVVAEEVSLCLFIPAGVEGAVMIEANEATAASEVAEVVVEVEVGGGVVVVVVIPVT